MLTTIDEAKSDLRQESHKNWKLITPTQIRNYKRNMVVAICLDQSCRQMAYFVPTDAMPKQDVFEAALAVAKKHDAGFMSVIQCNLDKFPEITFAPIPIAEGSFLELKIKPTGRLVLHPRGYRNHVTYSIGKLHSLKYSATSTIKQYFSESEWQIKASLDIMCGNVTLSLTNKSTHQNGSVTLNLHENEISGNITFNKSRFKFERWVFYGSYGIDITGKVIRKLQSETPKPTTIHHKSIIEIAGFIIGVTALGFLTDGAGFALFAS